MQNSDPTSRSVLIQTTLRVAENEDEELLVVSDRGCQTVTTVSPDVLNANIVPLLEYTPYSEIVANSLKIYDLPRKYQLQFDLSGHHQRDRHPSIDGNVKSALKKNSSEADESGLEDEEGVDLEEIFYVQPGLSAQLEAMRKVKADEDIQTDLTVIPPVLDDDGIANVCTQLAVQTSITFPPDASLSRITPDLKTPMKHTHEYQAIMINGKIVPNYTDDYIPPPTKDELDTEEETETTAPITDTDELTLTDTTSAAEEAMQVPQNTPILQHSLTMTEEEFEKNVQRILEKTVANVYDFMAKIVEIYEQSKEALGSGTKADHDSKGRQTTDTKKHKMRNQSLILNDRQKAFKYLEEYHQGVIPPAQVELIELPDGSKVYNITQEVDDLKIKIFETSSARRMDDPTHVLKLIPTPKSREPRVVAERTDEDEEREVPDREKVEQILAQIHAGAMDPTQYVVIDNVDGTKSFVVQDDDGELEILEVADLYVSDSELTDGTDEEADQVDITTEEELISTEELTEPTQLTEEESTEFTTEQVVAGEETTEPLETTEPTTGEAEPSGPGIGDIIGDSPTPHKGPEVQCECCIVKESGNAPPCLNELDDDNVLTFELNIPTGSTVEKTFDGIKVKANISRPDQLKTEQIITVSVNVAGAEPVDDSCSCSGDRAEDKCEDCEGLKPKKSPKCDCPDDKEEDKPLEPEQPPTDLKSCDCSETKEVIKPPPEPEICDCHKDEPPPPPPPPKTSQKCVCPSDHKKEDLPPPKTSQKCVCPGDHKKEDLPLPKTSQKCVCPSNHKIDQPLPAKISQKCVCPSGLKKEDLPKERPITPRICDCSDEDGITTSISTLASDDVSKHSTHTEPDITEAVSTCTCETRKPQYPTYDSESIIATCSCGNVTSAPELAHKMEATNKNLDVACDNICSRNKTVSIACGSDAPPKKRPVRINEELCDCIRKELTQSRPTSGDGCKCRGTSSKTKSHSCSCIDKEEYVEPEGICQCKPKPPPRAQTVSTPKVCQCNVKNVMDQLRQKTSCVKDSKMVEKHMNTLQPLLQKIGTADSKPDARVSSVQVIYKKPDAKKSDKMCACNIQDVRGEAPPVTPMVNVKTKSCNCDLNAGVGSDLAPLYQEDDEYNETYLNDMFENVEADGDKCACSSLPEVVTSTDKCGSRTEMPWMKIALPPPGTFEIQKIPKKGCQCGKQAPKPELKQEYGQPPICRCREPRPTKPTVKCTCNRADSSSSAPCRCNVCKCGGYIPKKKPPPLSPKDPTNEYKDITCPELCDLKEGIKNSPQPPNKTADVQQELPSSDVAEPAALAIERKCSCANLQKSNNECEDTMRRTKMIYDDDNVAYNEEYMNPLCKMFADAAEDTGECGLNAEINWDEITIPKRVRLKQCPARKKMPTSYSEMSGVERLPPIQQSIIPKQPAIPMIDMQRPSKQSRVADAASIIQLKLHFSGYTEVTSTIIPVVGGAQSQRTLTEYSEISDLRMQLKRCTPSQVGMLDPGFGVGSQPFAIMGGQIESAPFDMPSPGVQSIPQMPEKVSDLIGMFNYETAFTSPTPQKMPVKEKPSVRGKQSVSISEGPRRTPVQEESMKGRQSLCQPSDCGKYQAPKEPPPGSTCPPEDCTKQDVCVCSPTQGDDGSVATMTSTEFREKYNLKTPEYKTEMFLEGKPMSMYTSTEPGTEPYDPRMMSRLAEMNLRLTAADSLFGVHCSCEKITPAEKPQTAQIPKRRSKADCSCGKLIKGSKTKCVCGRPSKIRPQKQPKKEPPCLCVEEALTKLKNPIITALETCEREMKPLHDTLNQLRSKVQSMDIPELDNWTAGTSLSSCYAAMYGKNKQQINFFVPETLGPFQQYSSNMQKKPQITSVSSFKDPLIQAYKRKDTSYYGQKEQGKDTYLLKDREEIKLEGPEEKGRNDLETTETSEKDASKDESEEFNQRTNKWEKRPCGKETKAIQNNNHPKLCEHCLRALHKNKKGMQGEYKRNETDSDTTEEYDETSNSGIHKITKEIQQLVEESMGLGNIIKERRNEAIISEGQSPFKSTINTVNHMRKDIECMVDESMALDKLHVDQKRIAGKQSVKSAKVTQSEFSISFCGLFTPVSSDTASSIVSDGKQKKIKELLNLGFDSKQSLSASSGDQVTTCYQAASAPIQSHSEILLGNHFSNTADKNNGIPNNYPYVMHPYYPTNQHPGNYYPNMYNPYMFHYGPLCYNDMYNNPYQNSNYTSYLPCKMDERTKGKRSSSNASKTTSRSTTSVSSSDSTTVKSSVTSTSTHSGKTSKTSNSDYPSTRDCDETTDIIDSLTDDAVDEKRVDAGDSPTTSYTKDSASKSQGRRKLVRITVKTTPSGNKIISKEEVFDSSTSTTYK